MRCAQALLSALSSSWGLTAGGGSLPQRSSCSRAGEGLALRRCVRGVLKETLWSGDTGAPAASQSHDGYTNGGLGGLLSCTQWGCSTDFTLLPGSPRESRVVRLRVLYRFCSFFLRKLEALVWGWRRKERKTILTPVRGLCEDKFKAFSLAPSTLISTVPLPPIIDPENTGGRFPSVPL